IISRRPRYYPHSIRRRLPHPCSASRPTPTPGLPPPPRFADPGPPDPRRRCPFCEGDGGEKGRRRRRAREADGFCRAAGKTGLRKREMMRLTHRFTWPLSVADAGRPRAGHLRLVFCASAAAFATLLAFNYFRQPLPTGPPLVTIVDADQPLRCVQGLKNAAARNLAVDPALRDAITLLADTFDYGQASAFRAELNATMHLVTAEDVRRSVEASGSPCSGGGLPRLAVCSLASSSAPYVQEWIAHNILLGATKLVLYDNDDPASTPSLEFRRAVRPFAEAGYVHVVDWYFQPTERDRDTFRQVEAQNHCLDMHRSDVDWIAFIDLDEYIVLHQPPMQTACLTQVLAGHRDEVGFVVPWRDFGPVGVARHDHRRTSLEQYRWAEISPHNASVEGKSIVNTRYVKKMIHPHFASYPPFRYAVDALGNPANEHISFRPKGWVGYWNPHANVELRHFWGRDVKFTLSDKVCSFSYERDMFSDIRAAKAVRLLNSRQLVRDPDLMEHHQVALEQFLWG
ncbi:MAG: glycosyltransferase family 92-domain-containing protein, partial [Olpidium bornovanus]